MVKGKEKDTIWPNLKSATIYLIPEWPPHGKKLARVARKRSHKGQFGWNKNKKVNQLALQKTLLFSFAFNVFFATEYMKTVRKRHLTLMTSFSCNSRQFFSAWWPFWNKVYLIWGSQWVCHKRPLHDDWCSVPLVQQTPPRLAIEMGSFVVLFTYIGRLCISQYFIILFKVAVWPIIRSVLKRFRHHYIFHRKCVSFEWYLYIPCSIQNHFSVSLTILLGD